MVDEVMKSRYIRPCLIFTPVKYLSIHKSDFCIFFSAVIVVIISVKLFGWHKYPNLFTTSIKCWMYHHWLFYYFFKEEVDSNEFEFDASIFYHENNLNEVEIIYQFLKLVYMKLNHSPILCTVCPHIVAPATILFWIHKTLKISYSFLIKFSLM